MVPAFFIILNIFYFFLQSRFIFGGDSAEYATIGRIWAAAHPPGYPLYSLLANLINLVVPFGSTPWKIALLSSVPTILTAYVFYRIFELLKVNRAISLLSALLYLVLFPVWQYALIPEVFGLHAFLTALTTYHLLRYVSKKGKKHLYVSSFIFGLNIAHHHIFVLFIPGWIALLKGNLIHLLKNKKVLLRMGYLMFLGASFYLYAIIVSFNKTIINWEDAKTVTGFFRLITRSVYGSFKAYSGSGGHITNQITDMLSGFVFMLIDFKPLGILFIFLGIYVSRKYMKEFALFLFFSLIMHFVFLFYTNFVLTTSISTGMYERFLIPLYGVLILYFGLGVDYFYKKIYLRIVHIMKNIYLKHGMRFAYYVFVCIYIFLIGSQNFKAIASIAGEKTFDRFGKDIISTVPKGGILATQGDTSTFVSYYHLYGLRERGDIVALLLGLSNKPNYVEMVRKRWPNLVLASPEKITDDLSQFFSQNKQGGFYTDQELGIAPHRTYGLLWKYYESELAAASDSAALLAKNKYFWEKAYSIPILTKAEKNIFHLNSVNEYYVNAYRNYAKLLVSLGKNNEAEEVLKNIAEVYRAGDIQSSAIYMNMLVLNKKCTEASRVAEDIGLRKTVDSNPGFAKSAVAFLEKCDPKSTDLPHYRKVLLEKKSETKTDLDSF